MQDGKHNIELSRNGGQLLARWDGSEETIPVRIVWASPLQAPAGGVSILHASKKQEIAFLPSLDALAGPSREIAAEELGRRYFLPKIRRVLHTRASFGNRYWHVETDRGSKRFLMKSPETNATWLTDDRCILRDSLGNCYEIESLQALDSQSRARVEAVL